MKIVVGSFFSWGVYWSEASDDWSNRFECNYICMISNNNYSIYNTYPYNMCMYIHTLKKVVVALLQAQAAQQLIKITNVQKKPSQFLYCMYNTYNTYICSFGGGGMYAGQDQIDLFKKKKKIFFASTNLDLAKTFPMGRLLGCHVINYSILPTPLPLSPPRDKVARL